MRTRPSVISTTDSDSATGDAEPFWENGELLRSELRRWSEQAGVRGAAVFAAGGEAGEPLAGCGDAPATIGGDDLAACDLPGGYRLIHRGAEESCPDASTRRLLSAAARLLELERRLKRRTFEDSYRTVTLEALYDVGLAIASTLNLDELTEGILLRAVSLLDARRGALYLLEGDEYRLVRTIGGAASERFGTRETADDSPAERLREHQPLPGASHLLAVPIEVEASPRGYLVVADKESRTGVGPFADADERALSLFANQAAIALENAQLHRQALEKERMEREMELAADIQRGLLPVDMPTIDGFEILGWNRPTRHVGGDYFGFLPLEGGRLGVVVADVTGKGLPAALLVSTLHSALHLLLDQVEPGVEMLSRLNQHIADSSAANKFITLICAEIDWQDRRIRYLNAGHNPGLLVRSGGELERLEPTGLPLGLLQRATYELREIEVEPGDLICLYSDGITECESREEEEFGEERLAEFLRQRRDEPLCEILSSLDRTVTDFAAGRPQGDDQTVVLLRADPS